MLKGTPRIILVHRAYYFAFVGLLSSIVGQWLRTPVSFLLDHPILFGCVTLAVGGFVLSWLRFPSLRGLLAGCDVFAGLFSLWAVHVGRFPLIGWVDTRVASLGVVLPPLVLAILISRSLEARTFYEAENR